MFQTPKADHGMNFFTSAAIALVTITIMITTSTAEFDGNGQENSDPVAEAFYFSIKNGAPSDNAFDAASNVAVESILENQTFSGEEIEHFRAFATEIWQNERARGAEPGEAFNTARAAVQEVIEDLQRDGDDEEQGEQDNQVKIRSNYHYEGNCEALCAGQSQYWVHHDVNGQSVEEGPFAVWQVGSEGSRVICGCNYDTIEDAFFSAVESGANPDEAFEVALYVASKIFRDELDFDQAQVNELLNFVRTIWQDERIGGKDPGKAFQAVLEAARDGIR